MTKFEVFLTCILSVITIVMISLVVVTGETAKRVEKMSDYFGLEEKVVVCDSISDDLDAFELDDTTYDYEENFN